MFDCLPTDTPLVCFVVLAGKLAKPSPDWPFKMYPERFGFTKVTLNDKPWGGGRGQKQLFFTQNNIFWSQRWTVVRTIVFQHKGFGVWVSAWGLSASSLHNFSVHVWLLSGHPSTVHKNNCAIATSPLCGLARIDGYRKLMDEGSHMFIGNLLIEMYKLVLV